MSSPVETPFLREVIDIDKLPCKDEPSYSHTTYDLFALKTRLRPYILTTFGKRVYATFEYKLEGKVMRLMVTPSIGPKPISMTKTTRDALQEEVNNLVNMPSQHCMIFNPRASLFDRNNHLISVVWLESITRFITVIPEEYKPSVQNGYLYVDLHEEHNYSAKYDLIHKDIVEQILDYYHMGYIVEAEEIAKNWGLEQVNKDINLVGEYPLPKIYVPTWSDERFAPFIVDFLQDRLQGIKFITLCDIGINKVTRHYISIAFNKIGTIYFFQGSDMRFEATNLNEAMEKTTLALDQKDSSYGEIMTINANRLSWVKIYKELSKAFWGKDAKCTVYIIKETYETLVFSCTVPIGTNLVTTIRDFRSRSFRLIEFIRKKLNSKDIHSDIERHDIDILRLIGDPIKRSS